MLNKNDIKELLSSRFANDLHQKLSQIPLPCRLKDTYKAAERIKKAVDSGENIVVVGDYDVDGIVSTALMSEFFSDVGANFTTRIPNRFKDGYGLNAAIIGEFKNASLIITVDNGINAFEAADICKEKGIDLIITDHHMPAPTLPQAYAIINPKQPECHFPNIEICGAQVAWYLIGALKEVFELKNYDMGKFLDLLALAIVADMMELRDLNRILVRLGLSKINASPRQCFTAIRQYYGRDKFEFDDISYLIAPLINSAGRMDDASISFKFLMAKNLNDANRYFDMILEFNAARKEQEKILFESSILGVDESDDIIVTWGNGWHEGVLGIVASRLAKRYNKPAIVFSIDGDKAKGSARSVGKFDILKAIGAQESMLLGFGGHKGAAGLSIESANLEKFKKAININSQAFLSDAASDDELLGEIDFRQIDLELLDILETFEPYGQKNPKPVFSIKNAIVRAVKAIGVGNNHIKITLEKQGQSFEAVFFNYNLTPKIGQSVDLLVWIAKNRFGGKITPSILIKEILG